MATVSLALRLAGGNFRWEYRIIAGEINKLGVAIRATTVREILKNRGIHPACDKAFKKPAVPWTVFAHAHSGSPVCVDLLAMGVYKRQGVLTTYVLAHTNVGTRKDYRSSVSHHPDGGPVVQQARSAVMWPDDMGVPARRRRSRS